MLTTMWKISKPTNIKWLFVWLLRVLEIGYSYISCIINEIFPVSRPICEKQINSLNEPTSWSLTISDTCLDIIKSEQNKLHKVKNSHLCEHLSYFNKVFKLAYFRISNNICLMSYLITNKCNIVFLYMKLMIHH